MPVATLIGDIVDSRRFPQRQELHDRLSATLQTLRVPAIESPAITVGDELQGVYRTVGDALDAGFRLRLALLPDIDVRCGIGWGSVTLLDHDTGVQDGPGWWAARAAIDTAKEMARAAAFRVIRTAYRAYSVEGPSEPAVTAALHCRDHLVGSLDNRSLTILRGLMADQTQHEIATSMGISPSAVSQRVRRDGLAVVVAAQHALAEVA